jgi:hypothetical protein
MTTEQFEQAVIAVQDFVSLPPTYKGRRRVIGIFGGEPLMCPEFPEYVDILCRYIPRAWNRGLWTSLDWTTYTGPYGKAEPLVRKLLEVPCTTVWDADGPAYQYGGYLNWNMHKEEVKCEHQPVLVSVKDVVADPVERWKLIENCWVNRDWSSAIALDSEGELRYYFCEIASAFDGVMPLGCGLPVTPDCWKGPLEFKDTPDGRRPIGPYAKQIEACCERCGACVPLQGRRDREWRDDISASNLAELRDSPMIRNGAFVPFEDIYNPEKYLSGWCPQRYLKGGNP